MDSELEILLLKKEILELKYGASSDRLSLRYNENHDPDNGQFTSGSQSAAAFTPVDENSCQYYKRMTREQRAEVIRRGQACAEPVFSDDVPGNPAMQYLSKTPSEPHVYDVKAHGTPDYIEFFCKSYNDERRYVDAYTLSLILRGRDDYKAFIRGCKEAGVQPQIRLLSCSTGAQNGSRSCFAQQLATELGISVKAPTTALYVYKDGHFEMEETGYFMNFNSGR